MFTSVFQQYNWDEVRERIYAKTTADVTAALKREKRGLDDFMALISPAAKPFRGEMAVKSHHLTRLRFGKTMQLFAPLYLSNECQNICTYCGYSFDHKLKRKTLTDDEIKREAEAVRNLGFRHVLLVTGEANSTVNIDYFLHAIDLLKPYFSNISLEVQPLETEEYKKLHDAGVHSILVYQETYHQETYKTYHPKGKKSNFNYRLETPDRIGESGMHKIGVGVLLGLEDWRTDSFFCAAHLQYLQKKYWQTKYSVSFPRIRPAEGVTLKSDHVSDEDLLQLILAYRLFDPDAELSVSTRESRAFRDAVIPLGPTSMSAGSKTNPGGYVTEPDSLEQFEIEDNRSPEEFMKVISSKGYEPVWKDWDHALAH
jgi:2-iminoacetate synthase